MSPGWNAKPPKDGSEYFERMTKAIFAAGLNWSVVEKKWPGFRAGFSGFSIDKITRYSEKDVKRLMADATVVRNERKIRATIANAGEFRRVEKEFGSFGKYLLSFGRNENKLQEDLQEKFKHMGPSTSRFFLWSVGHPLTPNAGEKKWMSGQHEM